MTTPHLVPIYWHGRIYDFALVDHEDFVRVSANRWTRVSGDYAVSGRGLMHRWILGLAKGEGIVHHINEDTLDNRRSNLMVCANTIEHGSQPHPRRDLVCGGTQDLPKHERELLIEEFVRVFRQEVAA